MDLVGIVDKDERRRQAIAALLYLELGVAVLEAADMLSLGNKFANQRAALLIHGWSRGDDQTEIEAALARVMFPLIPTLSIGPNTARGYATPLDFPVDARHLVERVSKLLGERNR